jgi:hypothetical protein
VRRAHETCQKAEEYAGEHPDADGHAQVGGPIGSWLWTASATSPKKTATANGTDLRPPSPSPAPPFRPTAVSQRRAPEVPRPRCHCSRALLCAARSRLRAAHGDRVPRARNELAPCDGAAGDRERPHLKPMPSTRRMSRVDVGSNRPPVLATSHAVLPQPRRRDRACLSVKNVHRPSAGQRANPDCGSAS